MNQLFRIGFAVVDELRPCHVSSQLSRFDNSLNKFRSPESRFLFKLYSKLCQSLVVTSNTEEVISDYKEIYNFFLT